MANPFLIPSSLEEATADIPTSSILVVDCEYVLEHAMAVERNHRVNKGARLTADTGESRNGLGERINGLTNKELVMGLLR